MGEYSGTVGDDNLVGAVGDSPAAGSEAPSEAVSAAGSSPPPEPSSPSSPLQPASASSRAGTATAVSIEVRVRPTRVVMTTSCPSGIPTCSRPASHRRFSVGAQAVRAVRVDSKARSRPSRSSSSATRRPTTRSVTFSRTKVPTAEKAKTAPVA